MMVFLGWSSSAFTKTCLFAWRFVLLYIASLPPQEGNYEPNSFNSLGSKAISKEVFWFGFVMKRQGAYLILAVYCVQIFSPLWPTV